MGTNFHTAWIDGTTLFKASAMNAPLASLDKAVTYLKNVIVHCDGEISYNTVTGVLAWANVLRILFVREDGQAIQNTVAAGNVTLTDNDFAYVDVNEINDSVITVGTAPVTTGAESNYKAVNRVVLAYRNTVSDDLFLVNLRQPVLNIEPATAENNFLVAGASPFKWLRKTLTEVKTILGIPYVHPNHSGDVTSVGDGAQTIAAKAVTYAKIQDISATDKILGRASAEAGVAEEIACTAAGRALLDDVDAAAQLITLGLSATAAEINKLDGAGAIVASGTQQAHVTDANVAHDLNATFSDIEVEAALNALGTKINSVLAALEAFGINSSV